MKALPSKVCVHRNYSWFDKLTTSGQQPLTLSLSKGAQRRSHDPLAHAFALALLLLLALVLASAALAQAPLPQPVGHVNDFAEVISSDVEKPLEDALRLFQEETTVELVVVTVPDLGGDTVEQYAVRLFNEWGIGKKDVDNGVLLLLGVQERSIKIEVGYGMEPYLTDGQVGRILDNDVLPDFREGNYSLGITKGMQAMAETIANSDYQPGEVRSRPAERTLPPVNIGVDRLWVLGPLAMFTIYLISFMARTRSFWFGGVWGAIVGGVLGWLLGGVLAIVGLAVLAGILGLMLDAALSSAYVHQKSSGRPTGWRRSMDGFSGAGRGGWTGSKGIGGGSFKGFGGGRSGGGGASRRF
ncbi:MAG: hypothetical protein FJ316_05605 [SAR202 cluster bacterium]|nr:hypothetical protein [SAR202 cluster bacterium]